MICLDTVILFVTIGISLLGYIPLIAWLEPFPRLFFPAALLFRLIADRKGFRIDARLVTAGSVIVFLVYLFQVSRSDIVGPVVSLLVVLLGVRFLGERTTRNYLQILLLSLFCLAASSLFSLDVLFMMYLVLQVVLFEIALVLLACHDRNPGIVLTRERFSILLSVPFAMLALSVPLLLLFFVILPRTQFPLWEFPANPAGKKTGFSETVQPGSAAAIGEAREVAFRAECGKLSPEELYWRGIVLNRYDGNAWSRTEPPAGEFSLPGKGPLVMQRLFLEPGNSRYLVALDLPVQVSGVRWVGRAPDFTLSRRYPTDRRSFYEVGSSVVGKARGRLGHGRGFYLETPQQLPSWFREQGARFMTQGGSDRERLVAVEAFFRSQQLAYASTDLPVTKEPLVEFLTVKRRGNCEFFASSCALLLRLSGVPARLVGGYLGGDYNDLGGYYLVTGDRAHVWVEAYLEGEGWVRVDPSRWAVNAAEIAASTRGARLRSLILAVDTLTYVWNRQVIAYDLERQILLFNEAGRLLQPSAKFRLHGFVGLILGLALASLIWMGVRMSRSRFSLEGRLVARFLERLRRCHGVVPEPDVGLHELTEMVDDPAVRSFVSLYGRSIYRDRRLDPGEIRKLRGFIRSMKRPVAGTVREKVSAEAPETDAGDHSP